MEGKNTERAERPIAEKLELIHEVAAARSAGSFFLVLNVLGFRSASPEALCPRHAPRAQ